MPGVSVAAGEAVGGKADASRLEAVFYCEGPTLSQRFYKELEEGSGERKRADSMPFGDGG